MRAAWPPGRSVESMIIRVRVRGIYATALTKLFIERGYQIVQASSIISHRFGIPQIQAPADVTVKSDDRNPSRLLVIGYPHAVKEVESTLREAFSYSIYRRAKLPLYATVKAKIQGISDNKCLAKVGEVAAQVEMPLDKCEEGKEVLAYVARTAFTDDELPLLRPGVRVVGDYASLYVDEYREPKVTFSEHIRNANKKALLLALSEPLTSKGISVHWRSNAKIADERELEAHLKELHSKLGTMLSSSEGYVVSEGEDLVLIEFSCEDKRLCDELRNAVVPTAPLHHTLKSSGDNLLSSLADFADKLAEYDVERGKIERALTSFLVELARESKELRVFHLKLSGEEIVVRASVADAYVDESGGARLVLRRYVRSHGVYDGLNVEKEPGDTIETTIVLGSWYVKHEYYSRDGELKGIYININTPPELWSNTVRYLDLEVDVVKRVDEVQILDADKLLEFYKRRVVTKRLACRALEEALAHGKGARNLEEVKQLKELVCAVETQQ